jgi:predicted YcjX-like family ATPase
MLSLSAASEAPVGSEHRLSKIWTRRATERGEVDFVDFDGRPRLDLVLLATTIQAFRQQIAGKAERWHDSRQWSIM